MTLSRHQTVLVILLLLGAALRLHGMTWTLPYLVDGDEWRVINSGLSVYYIPDADDYPDYFPHSYPPLRLWEVSLTRAALVMLWDEPISITLQALVGRLLSLFYALLTSLLIYRIALQINADKTAAIIAATLFVTWPQSIRYGQLVLTDGLALLCFVATIWCSIGAYQRQNPVWLAAALILGGLTLLAKYNLGTVLLLPGLLTVRALRHQFWGTVRAVIVPVVLVIMLLGMVLAETFRPDRLGCYVRHTDSCTSDAEYSSIDMQFSSVNPSLSEQFRSFFTFIPPYVLPAAVIGGLYLSRLSNRINGFVWRVLLALVVMNIALIGASRFAVPRQYMGVMVILFLIFAAAVRIPSETRWQHLLIGLVVMALGWQIRQAWIQNDDHYKPDSRVATVEWFVQHAPSGTRIASEPALYEFNALNGYTSDKVFEVFSVSSAARFSAAMWCQERYSYLVADEYFAPDGGFYGFDAHQRAELLTEAVIVAQFHPPTYAGPQRTILHFKRCDS